MSSNVMSILSTRQAVAFTGLTLSVGLLGIGLLFAPELRAAVAVWMLSTAYGHCFFVIPIALFLAWERRSVAVATPIVPMPLLALLALPLGLLWLVTERLGIMEGQQFLVLGFFELMFAAVLGWRMVWTMAVPLLYLGFLVPSGAFLTPALQNATAHFITGGLDLLRIPYYSDGLVIEIAAGKFFVAEACAGLRFLIASIAFGVLYACMIYRSPGRRAVFIAASIVVPVIANGLRALAIVVLGSILGSAEAAVVDHIVYGWVFFSFVLLVLILVGLPFREDGGPLPIPRYSVPLSAPAPLRLVLAAGLVLVLSSSAPALAVWFDHLALTGTIDTISPGAIAGCTQDTPQPAREAGQTGWAYACHYGARPDETLILTVTAFSPHADAGTMTRQRRIATGELGAEDITVRNLRSGDNGYWRLVNTIEPDRISATAEWVDGVPASGGLRQRWRLALNSVTGNGQSPVLVTMAPPFDEGRMQPATRQEVETAILRVLDANPGLAAQIAAAGKRPGA
jgi:exosortase A